MRTGLGYMLAAAIMVASPVVTIAGDESTIFTLSANGSRNTRPFTVKDRWEIRWENKGSILTVAVRTAEGKLVAGGGSATAPGTGESFQPKGGTYFLDVTGIGDWTISVVQLP